MKDLKFDLQLFGEVLNGTSGDDTLTVNGSSVAVYAGDGDDFIKSEYHYIFGDYIKIYDNTLDGGNGNDIIQVRVNGNTTLIGGAGDDNLYAYNGSSYNNNSSGISFYGGEGNDYIYSASQSSTIYGGKGDDTIQLSNSNYSFSESNHLIVYEEGDGNDIIYGYKTSSNTISLSGGKYNLRNVGDNVVISVIGSGTMTITDATDTGISIVGGVLDSIIFTEDDDYYKNTIPGAVLNLLAGDDTIVNSLANNVTIDAGEGADTIYNDNGNYSSINAGAGNDTIWNSNGNSVTIYAGDGNDYIYEFDKDGFVDGGPGNDFLAIHIGGTVKGGKGNDTVDGYNDIFLYQYESGDGNDTIYNYNGGSTISLGGESYTQSVIENNVVVSIIGSGTITLLDSKGENINIVGGTFIPSDGDIYISNSESNKSVKTGAGNDTITNSGDNVLVESGAGNDSILNDGKKATIYGGAGSDTIDNTISLHPSKGSGTTLSIDGGEGDDYIYNHYGWYSTITGGMGNDYIYDIYGGYSTINGGAGDDVISIDAGEKNTISGGSGNDSIYVSNATVGATVLGGDGNDTIINYLGGNTQHASIDGGNGDDYISNAGGYNTITGGAGNDTVLVYGTSGFIDAGAGNNVISLANTATKNSVLGGEGNNTIYADEGFNDNVVLYRGVAGNDVIYGLGKDARIIISRITYSKEIVNEDLILHIGTGKVTLVGGAYEKLDIGGTEVPLVTTPADTTPADTTPAETTPADTTPAETTPAETTAPDTYANNDLPDGLLYNSTKVAIMVEPNFKGSAVDITKYAPTARQIRASSAITKALTLSGNGHANSLRGGSGNDTLSGLTGSDTLTGGNGNDVFVYSGGTDFITDYTSGEDKIKLSGAEIKSTSISGANVILKTDKGNLTVKGARGKQITVVDKNNNETTQYYYEDLPTGLLYNSTQVAIMIEPNFKGSTVDITKYAPTARQLRASSAITKALTLSGNGHANSLRGGSGNDTLSGLTGSDTLTGGNGNDVFVYSGGTDFITDYTEGEDKIKLSGAEIKSTSISGANVILKTDKGNLTVKGARGKQITVIDKNNNETTQYYYETLPSGLLYNSTQVAIMVEPNFKGSTVDITKYAPTARQIRASSAITKALTLSGNGHANSLKGGSGNDTLSGLTGSDTLTGGKGNDVFVYSGGTDFITDYTSSEDKIKLSGAEIKSTSISGANVILKTDKGNLTVNNARGKQITVVDKNNNETTQYYYETLQTGLSYDANEVVISADKNFTGNTIDLTKYAPTARKIRVSSTVAQNVSIVGNGHSNSLRGGNGHDTLSGGSGNDTLTGGAGADVFIYSIGKDVITDYKEGRDTIRLSSGKISAMNYSGNDVIFTIGSGTLTVKDAKGTNISVTDSSGTQTYSTSAKTLSLLDDDNFLTNDTSLDSITEQKFSVTQIQTLENSNDSLPGVTYSELSRNSSVDI